MSSNAIALLCFIGLWSPAGGGGLIVSIPDLCTLTYLDKQIFERKIFYIFLPISFNICFGCSKDPSH